MSIRVHVGNRLPRKMALADNNSEQFLSNTGEPFPDSFIVDSMNDLRFAYDPVTWVRNHPGEDLRVTIELHLEYGVGVRDG